MAPGYRREEAGQECRLVGSTELKLGDKEGWHLYASLGNTTCSPLGRQNLQVILRELGSHRSALYYLCDLGQVILALWASVFLSVQQIRISLGIIQRANAHKAAKAAVAAAVVQGLAAL